MADQYPITQAEFRAWLLTKRLTHVVGRKLHGGECPLACYLKARGDRISAVTSTAIYAHPDRELAAPAWVTSFVRAIDNGPATVTARTALRLLDRVAHASLPEDEADWERTALESEAVGG